MAYNGKKGKHDDWIKGEGLEKVCEWARHGLNDNQLLENIGISRATFYKQLKAYPDFAAALKKARIQPNIEIENSMFELACGKMYVEEIKTTVDPKDGSIAKIEKTRKQVPPNPVMLIFLAKTRMRDKYKDYAPVPYEPDNAEEKQNVQIYLPDNGRDEK